MTALVFNNLHVPDVEFLVEQHGVVEVRDGSLYRITVSHLHHRSTWFALHELHLQKQSHNFSADLKR